MYGSAIGRRVSHTGDQQNLHSICFPFMFLGITKSIHWSRNLPKVHASQPWWQLMSFLQPTMKRNRLGIWARLDLLIAMHLTRSCISAGLTHPIVYGLSKWMHLDGFSGSERNLECSGSLWRLWPRFDDSNTTKQITMMYWCHKRMKIHQTVFLITTSARYSLFFGWY